MDRCGRGTLGLFIPVSTLICTVLEAVGGDISSGWATLGGDLNNTLGGGSALRRVRGMVGDATINFSGAVFCAGAGR